MLAVKNQNIDANLGPNVAIKVETLGIFRIFAILKQASSKFFFFLRWTKIFKFFPKCYACFSHETPSFQLSLKVAREEHQRQEQQHLNDKQLLSEQLNEKDRQYQDLIRDTKALQTEEIERLREHFEERVRDMEKRYSTRVSTLRNDLQLRLKSEVSETEERKNTQIEQMKRKHEKAFNEIKNYYNDITLNNLAMIRYRNSQKLESNFLHMYVVNNFFSNPSIFTTESANIKLSYIRSAVSRAKIDRFKKFKTIVVHLELTMENAKKQY